jgi:hypothetical protein
MLWLGKFPPLEAVRNNRTDLKHMYTEAEKGEGQLLIDMLAFVRQRIRLESDGESSVNSKLNLKLFSMS